MTKTKIKFCGITKVDDYIFINNQDDVNYIGMIFTEKSPRCLTIDDAKNILQSAHRNKSIVGVFMNQSENYIERVIKAIDLDILQFHGDESMRFCKKFSKPYIKTFHIEHDTVNINSDFIDTDAQFLLDTSVAGKEGGTGQKFNWDILSNDISISSILEKHSFFIAGGLDNNNVRDLILHHKPYGIDVSSGLETSIGKKDHLLMKKFLENVRISEKEYYEKN